MVWKEVFPQNSTVGGLVYNAVVLSDDGQRHSSWAMVEACGEELACCRCKFKVSVLSLASSALSFLLCSHHTMHAHSGCSASSQAKKQQGHVTIS